MLSGDLFNNDGLYKNDGLFNLIRGDGFVCGSVFLSTLSVRDAREDGFAQRRDPGGDTRD